MLSACGTYRYRLTRQWDEAKPFLGFLMMNPSDADAVRDDPTVKRCVSFAEREGCGGIWVANLYGLRSPNIDALKGKADPIGPANDSMYAELFEACPKVVAAWGAYHPLGNKRVREVEAILAAIQPRVFTLGYTLGGYPRHPLFVRGNVALEPFRPYPGS